MTNFQEKRQIAYYGFTYLLVAVPPVLCLWFVKTFGVDVPFWDEWSCVDLLKNFYDHTVSWLDILRMQSGEHLVGVPYLLMIGLAKCTHYNVQAEMFLGCICLMGTWLLTLKLAWDKLPGGFMRIAALLPVSWLVCSLRQYETLLWGFQIQTPISIFFFVLSVYLLDRVDKYKYWPLCTAILSGVCSSLSFGSGLLIWPLGALQLLLKNLWDKDSHTSCKPLISWLIAASIVGSVLFLLYKNAYLGSNPYGLTAFLQTHHCWAIAAFFIAYLVSPLIPTINDNFANSYPDIVVSQGLVIATIYILVVALALRELKDVRSKAVVPLVLILYAVMSDCLTVLARVGGGINQALASRYTSISCLGIVGVYLILLIINKPSLKVRAGLMGALLAPIIASTIMCTKVGIEEGARIRIQRILLSYIVLSYKYQDPRLFPSLRLPNNFRELASFLEVNHLSVFRRQHPNLHIPKVHVD